MPQGWWWVMVVACGATEAPTPEPVQAVETERNEPMITLRYELEHTTIPVDADASTSIPARMGGALVARSTTDVTLEFRAFAAYQLDWLLTREDGVTFKPMFLPPPMPPPGGIPTRSVELNANVDTPVATLFGISGFYEESAAPQAWGPLPAGRYRGVIRNINVGTGPLATEPFEVVVE